MGARAHRCSLLSRRESLPSVAAEFIITAKFYVITHSNPQGIGLCRDVLSVLASRDFRRRGALRFGRSQCHPSIIYSDNSFRGEWRPWLYESRVQSVACAKAQGRDGYVTKKMILALAIPTRDR